jgi:hypothetical protein
MSAWALGYASGALVGFVSYLAAALVLARIQRS